MQRFVSSPTLKVLLLIGLSGFGMATGGSATQPIHSNTLRWRLGALDYRFGISREQAKQVIYEAAHIWESEANAHLFVENPANGFPIDFVFDSRQAKFMDYVLKKKQLTDFPKSLADDAKVNHAEDKKLKEQELECNRANKAYTDRLARYNSAIEYWNANGGASDDVRANLATEKQLIDDQYEALNKLCKTYNDKVSAFKVQIAEYNKKVKQHNDLVNEINKSDSRGFERVGVCNTRNTQTVGINIYAFASRSNLLRILTHELGHAMGLGHVSDRDAIMNEVCVSEIDQPVALTKADIHEFNHRG